MTRLWGRENAEKIEEEDEYEGNGFMTKEFVEKLFETVRELSKYSMLDILEYQKKFRRI